MPEQSTPRRRRWYHVVQDWSEWIAFGLGLLLGYGIWGQ